MKTAQAGCCLLLLLAGSAPAAEPSLTRLASGDYLLSDGAYGAVIGGSSRPFYDFYGYPTADALGSIVAFWPLAAAERNSLMVGSPSLRLAARQHHLAYSSVQVDSPKAAKDPLVVRAEAVFTGDRAAQAARIQTTYTLRPDAGLIEAASRLTNTGEEALEGLVFSLHYSADQVYPYETELYSRLHFELAPKQGHYVGWVDLNRFSDQGEPLAVDLAPGESHLVRYALVADRDSERLLRKIFASLALGVEPAVIRFQNLGQGPFEVVVRETSEDFVVFRSFVDRPEPLRLALPPGAYSVTGNFFPAVVEAALSVLPGRAAECTLVNPPRGRVRVAVRDEQGSPLPGKVTFIGLGETPSPYFQPHNPIETGLAWEEVKNSVHPGLSELEVELPVGTYLVSASRGPEYSARQAVLEVIENRRQELSFALDRVVETEGLLAVDLHLHTLRSDGSITARERVLSVVAEGVEVALASDHFFRHDYTPEVEALGLADFLTVIPGSEISIRNPLDYEYTLDFNLYPLRPGEAGWRAPETLSQEVAPIFEATRRRYPEALIQLNHPRNSSWDYFNSYQLDPKSAATARRGFWSGFDLLEVLNGPSPSFNDNAAAIRDWLNLLSRGFFYPAVGSSDSHQIDTEEPGYSRTYVYAPDREIANVDIPAVLAALRQGRSFVTNGPIVELTVNGDILPGDTLAAPDGEVELEVEVRAAPWIATDEARILVNGEVQRVLPIAAADEAAQRLDERVRLRLERDAFILVEVEGHRSLYPVVQTWPTSGEPPAAVMPYALTNPVFVDVDGNGRFDPPLPRVIRPLAAGDG